jgi:hypothetical protein
LSIGAGCYLLLAPVGLTLVRLGNLLPQEHKGHTVGLEEKPRVFVGPRSFAAESCHILKE